MGGRRTRVRTRVLELGTQVRTRVPQGGTRTWTRLETFCTRTRLVLGKGSTRSISAYIVVNVGRKMSHAKN